MGGVVIMITMVEKVVVVVVEGRGKGGVGFHCGT